MNTGLLIGAPMAAFVLTMFAIKERVGALAYLVFLLVAPNIVLLGESFRLEHVLPPCMLLILMLRRSVAQERIKVPGFGLIYVLWIAWLLAATFVSSPSDPIALLDWRAVYGYVRPLLVLIVFYNLKIDEDWIRWAAIAFAMSAIPQALLAVGQTSAIGFVRDFTELAYTSPGRDVFVRTVMDEDRGYLFRAICTFENVSYAAIFFLLSLFTGVLMWSRRHSRSAAQRAILLGSILASLVGGVLTYSATFIAGVALFWFWLVVTLRGKWRVWLVVLSVISGLAVIELLRYMPAFVQERAEGMTGYQVDRLLTGAFLNGRLYIPEGDYLLDSWRIALENPIVGSGFFSEEGLIVNDSVVIVLFYTGGLVGSGLFLAVGLMLLRSVVQPGLPKQLLRLWWWVMVITGFGAMSFFVVRLTDWWWAMAGAIAGLSHREMLRVLRARRQLPIPLAGRIVAAHRGPTRGERVSREPATGAAH
jgi:hypothetical protein